MKKYLPALLMAICSFIFFTISAQQKSAVSISGKITDASGMDVQGASIKVKGDIFGTTTDSAGTFRLLIPSLPITLAITHNSYEAQEILVDKNEIFITLSTRWKIEDEIIIGGGRIGISRRNLPVSVELITLKDIRQSASPSPYGILNYKNGVDFTTSSLNMKTPSTRGFNGSGSTRVNQLIDGMDNQAPGLNFFVGNFTGPTDLDVESIELLPGPSTALYGPGGMNGTILINSKNPFKYPGLSIQARQGIMHIDKSQRNNASSYYDYTLRWAKVVNDKFAFKIGAQYLNAKDWLANDSSNYDRLGNNGKLIPGNRNSDPNYDGVNVYGDETSLNMMDITNAVLSYATQQFVAGYTQMVGSPPSQAQINGFLSTNSNTAPFYLGKTAGIIPADQNVSRTGYAEKDIIDPETKNIKLSGALHYKLSEKIEALLMGNWATGNTVYTDDNRYALKGIKIAQYKLELKHKDWFLRSYTTQEDAGEAYSATVATQYFNESWKPSQLWYPQYVGSFVGAIAGGASKAQAHAYARNYADMGRPAAGSPQFRHLFDSVRSVPIPKGGLFHEKSQLWMTEGQYKFSRIKNTEIIVGGNYKKYILDSDGTIFIDSLKPINTTEIGAYAQITEKLLNDKLVLTASGRFDKNENFKGKFTPRIAALVKLGKGDNNNLRLSYQTAYRFPSNLTQWIRLDVGSDFLLLGGLPWVMDYMQADKYPVHQIVDDNGTIDPSPYVYKEFKPETMSSFEIGYKSLISNKLLLDAYAYFGKYKDFVGRIGLVQPTTGEMYSIVINSTNKVKTHGFGLGLDYRMTKNYSVFFNSYSDVITDVPAGFKSYFNTPKYRFNAGFANSGLGKKERIGFNVMMRWQDSFEWEGELANGPLKSFTTIDAQVSYKFPAIKSIFRLGGTNITNKYYQNAYGNPKIGGMYYASFIYNL